MHQTKVTAAFIENDAVGCFDHLINPLLLLQLRHLGAPATAKSSLSKTWSNTTHFIRTQYSISKESYKYSSEFPLFGPGQGSMIGPFLWLLCFGLIVDTLGPCSAMNFNSVGTEITISNTGDTFVNDSYLGATSTYTPAPGEALSTSQSFHAISAINNLKPLSQRWE